MDRLDDEHGVAPDDFYMEMFQPISDILQPQLPDQSPIMLADCDLTGAGDSGLPLNEPFHEQCPQAAVLDCKVCGKVFSRASSLKKHRLTHSKERRHICKVCKKAFKRQDHLMAHMLTHLKIKPFVCTEPGCSKSYCDFRSLKRHCEIHHGLWTKQQKIPTANPSKVPETRGPPVLSNNDINRCLVTEGLQQNVPSKMVVVQDPKASLVPQTMTLHSSSEDFTSRNTCTLVNSISTAPVDLDYVQCLDPSPLNSWWILPHKIQPKQEQPSIYTAASFNEAAVNGGVIEPLVGHSHDHNYNCPLLNNGHQTIMAHHTFTDFTRFTIQPCHNTGFHVQQPALPVTNAQPGISHTATLSLPICIPETNGILRGWGDIQGDHQGVSELSTIIGGTENVSFGSQVNPTWIQPAKEDQKLTVTKPEGCERNSEANEDRISLSLSSTVLPNQVTLESFSPPQGNKRTCRLPVSHQEDPGEGVSNWQHKLEPTEPCAESGAWTTEDTTAGHLLIPVSVPVPRTEDMVNEGGKKKRPCLKPLYIPPPILEKNSTSSGCFPNSVYNGGLQCQYTPPPMLSSIRHSSGLFINTFCSTSSAKYQCPRLYEHDSRGLNLDNSVYSVQPHINIGDRFQAVIPECRDRSLLGEEEKADLVWRPCILTDAMSHFLNLACSNAVPGGGCNLELALHCLHCSPGNVLEALDILLDKEPQTLLPGSLADYHYAGSDHWSVTEKCRFKNAYRKQRKNFSYIQSMIPEKSVYQCVEYYYTWKKIINFERHQTSPPRQAPSAEQSDGGGRKQPDSGGKAKSKKTDPKEKPLYSQNETGNREEQSIRFACQECDRVFDKVKSRNAHMKKHRMQEEKERILLYKLGKQAMSY